MVSFNLIHNSKMSAARLLISISWEFSFFLRLELWSWMKARRNAPQSCLTVRHIWSSRHLKRYHRYRLSRSRMTIALLPVSARSFFQIWWYKDTIAHPAASHESLQFENIAKTHLTWPITAPRIEPLFLGQLSFWLLHLALHTPTGRGRQYATAIPGQKSKMSGELVKRWQSKAARLVPLSHQFKWNASNYTFWQDWR